MSSRVLLLFVSIFFISFFGGLAAQAAEQQSEQDEYDFSWLDPEKKIYVVQNRKYTKANRLELAISGGMGLGEPYRTRRTIMPRGIYYLNEHWAVSGILGFNSNAENSNVAALASVASRIPAVRDVQSFVAGTVMWLPFYGKINMFNQIFYLDWHIEAGISQVASEIDLNTRFGNSPNIEEASYMAFTWGTGQKFFITKNWAARLDFLAQYYKAPSGVDGSLSSDAGAVQDSYDNYYVTVGLSYTF